MMRQALSPVLTRITIMTQLSSYPYLPFIFKSVQNDPNMLPSQKQSQ